MRSRARRLMWLRWVLLAAAVGLLVTFLVVQRQSIEVSYGQSPSGGGLDAAEAPGHGDVTIPSTAELTAMVEDDPVVRLPGAIAAWDEQQVQAAIGDDDVRILVAPPGLDSDQRARLREVDNATIRVVGTRVTGGMYEVVPSTLPEWRARFATGDITDSLVHLIHHLHDREPPEAPEQSRWRDPSSSELDTVVSHLRQDRLYAAPGATLTAIPEQADTQAFPGGEARYVALPLQPIDAPLPRYGPALAAEFPDTPIVVMYGSWIEYHGPHADEFAEMASATFYGQSGSLLSRLDYPQDNVLYAFLNRVTDIRYAGLFDRPLPYQPFDPMRVALPALPWLFAACVGGFLVLSVRSMPVSTWVRGRLLRRTDTAAPAELAGLSALAVELSLLTNRRNDPALARGISKLQAARTAVEEQLPDRHLRQLLQQASDELDDAARQTELDYLRPHHYLRDRSL